MSRQLRGDPSANAQKLGVALGILNRDDGSPNAGAIVNPYDTVTSAKADSVFEVIRDIGDGVASQREGGARFTIEGSPVQLAVGAIHDEAHPAESGLWVGVALPLAQITRSPDVSLDVEAWLLKVWPEKEGAAQFEPALGFNIRLNVGAVGPLAGASLGVRVEGRSDDDFSASLDLSLTPASIDVPAATSGGKATEITPPPVTLQWDLTASQDVLAVVVAAALSAVQVLLAEVAAGEAGALAGEVARRLLALVGLLPTRYEEGDAPVWLTPLDLGRLATDADGALQAWLAANFAPDAAGRSGAWVGTLTSLFTVTHKPAVRTVPGGWKADWLNDGGTTMSLVARRAEEGGRAVLRLGVEGTAGVTGQAEGINLALAGTITPFATALTGAPDIWWEKRFDVGLTLTRGTAGAALATGEGFTVSELRAGLSLTPERGLRPAVLADVVVGGDALRIDALDHPEIAVVAIATATLADALHLDLGSSPLAAQLAAAVGFAVPQGAEPTYPLVSLAVATDDPGWAWSEWLAKLQTSTASPRLMSSWLGAVRDVIATATGWETLTLTTPPSGGWVLQLGHPSSATAVALRFTSSVQSNRRQAELRVALVITPPTLPLPAGDAPVANVSTVLELGLLDAAVSTRREDARLVRFAPRVGGVWTLSPPAGAFSVPVGDALSARAERVEAKVGWDQAAGVDADVALVNAQVLQGATPYLTYPRLSAASLLARLGGSLADALKFAAIGGALGLWRVSPRAAGRAFVLPRLLGYWPDATGALDDPAIGKLFGAPAVEFPRLLARRLLERTSAGRHPLLLVRDLIFGDTPDVGVPDAVAVTGAGTYADPWAVVLRGGGLSLPLELLTWLDPTPNRGATHVGFGLRYTRADTVREFTLTEAARLDVVRVALTDGASEGTLTPLPAASLKATLRASDGWLLGDAAAPVRVAELSGALTWNPGAGFAADLRLKDAAFTGLPGGASLGWSDPATGPLLEALRAAPGGALAVGGAAAALLASLGALGLAEIDASRRTWALLRDPFGAFMSAPKAFLSARLTNAATGELDVSCLMDSLESRKAVVDDDGIGGASFALGAGVALSVSLGGWIKLSVDVADCAFEATLRPLDGRLLGTAAIHPMVYGDRSAELRAAFDTGPTARSTDDQARTRRFDLGLYAYGTDGVGSGLLEDGLVLYPPEAGLGAELLALLGKVAGGLFVKLVVDGVLLRALAASFPDAARALSILGVLEGAGTSASPYATSMGLLGALADPTGWCLAPGRIAALQRLIANRTFAEGRFRFRVDDTTADGVRTARAWIETATSITPGALSWRVSAGMRAIMPAGSTAPSRVEPFGSSRVSFAITNDPHQRTVALVVEVAGSDCTVDLVYGAGGDVADVTLRLYPWAGVGSLLADAAQPPFVSVLEQVWNELSRQPGVGRQLATAMDSAFAALDLLGDVATHHIDPEKWKDFVAAPVNSLEAIGGSEARRAAWATFFAGVGTAAGLSSSATSGLGVVRLGGGVELVSGHQRVNERWRFGVWLRLDAGAWASGIPLRPTMWDDDRARAGFYLEDGDAKPDVSLPLVLGVDLGARWVLDFVFVTRVSPTGAVSLGVGLEDDKARNSTLAVYVEFVPKLRVVVAGTPAAASADGDSWHNDVLRGLVVPLVGGILCSPTFHTQILEKKPDLDGDGRADLDLQIGDLFVAAGVLEKPGDDYLPTIVPDDWNLWTAVVGLLGEVLEKLSSEEARFGIYSEDEATRQRCGFKVNGYLDLLADPGLRLGFGAGQGRPATFPDRLTKGAKFNLRAIHRTRANAGARWSSWSFSPAIDVVGLNLFLTGPAQGALIADDAITLQGCALTADFSSDDVTPLGVLLHLDNLSFNGGMAAPSAATGVVRGVLPSRAADNPGFSLSIGYRKRAWHLCLGGGREDNVVWIDVHQPMGPLSLDRLGLGIAPQNGARWVGECIDLNDAKLEDQTLAFYYDGSLSIEGLQIRPWGLRLEVPLGASGGKAFYDPRNWKLNLDGLGIAWQSDGVSLAAGLYWADGEFIGAGVLRAGDFSLSALFAYSDDDGEPSFFGVASLGIPLGGPPVFYITKIAAGFGYNRALVTPDVTRGDAPAQVQDHFLVQALGDSTELALRLGEVKDACRVKPGSYWAAAGVGFRSFGLVEGTALLYARFDAQSTFGLMGTANLQVGVPDWKILDVKLGLAAEVALGGDDPRIAVMMGILDGSYLLHRDIALRGQAFIGYWFARGDFLISLGGYHKDFRPPAHYPRELTRLGLDVALGPVDIKGSMYFALTPREAMAGASFEACGSWGPLSAGVRAHFDVLIGWDPFYYALSAGLSIFGSIDLGFFGDLEIELGSHIDLFGPPFGGRVTLELIVVDVTIKFGATRSPNPPKLALADFKTRHLQLKGGGAAGVNVLAGRARTMAGPSGSHADPKGTREDPILIEPRATLEVHTRIPATAWTCRNGGEVLTLRKPDGVDDSLDFAPCGEAYWGLESEVEVSLSKGGVRFEFDAEKCRAAAREFPRAEWDRDHLDAESMTVKLLDRARYEFSERLTAGETRTLFLPMDRTANLPLPARRSVHPFARVTLPSAPSTRPTPSITLLGPAIVETAGATPVAATGEVPPRKVTLQAPAATPKARMVAAVGVGSGPGSASRASLPSASRPLVRRALEARARELHAGGTTIRCGGCLVFDLRPVHRASERLEASRVSGDAAVAARMVAFDRGGRVLCDTVLAAKTKLPPSASRVAFSAQPSTSGSAAVGFDSSTRLTAVDSGAWLAPGVVVRRVGLRSGAPSDYVPRVASAALADVGRLAIRFPSGAGTVVLTFTAPRADGTIDPGDVASNLTGLGGWQVKRSPDGKQVALVAACTAREPWELTLNPKMALTGAVRSSAALAVLASRLQGNNVWNLLTEATADGNVTIGVAES